jgi:hypothetical protein
MVAEVVDALVVLQAKTIEMVRHPLLVRPYEVKVLQRNQWGQLERADGADTPRHYPSPPNLDDSEAHDG